MHSLSPEHQQHLAARGLTEQTIADAGLWSASSTEATSLLGFPCASSGIAIPYTHPRTGAVLLHRIRPDIAPMMKGGKPAKYLSPKGAGNRLYFPPHAAAWLSSPAIPCGLTEGEFKTLWAYQVGLPYLGLTGVWGWRTKRRPPTIPELDLLQWHDRSITITFDSDASTNAQVQDAEHALALEMYRRGARHVYRQELPPDPNGEKTGMDDFLYAYGREAFANLDIEEIPSPYPSLQILTGVELFATAIDRPPSLVPGWGIRQGGKVILTGAGGRGKTTILSQSACDLAAGRPLFGHGGLAVERPQRVALLMAEDPLSEIKFRWVSQMTSLGYGEDVASRIAFLNPHGNKILLTSQYVRTVLFDALRQHCADVCILDPLISLHDADENNNAAMRAVLDLLSPFQTETGCTFILAHHEPKTTDSNSSASRGASAIRDWCRTMVRLTAQPRGPDGAQRLQLDLDKANYGGGVWALTVERQMDSYIFTPIEEDERVTPQQVWDAVGQDGEWLDDLKKILCETHGISEWITRKAITKAEELGIIMVEKQRNTDTNRQRSFVTRLKQYN